MIFKLFLQVRDSRVWIRAVRFSPDGGTLAVASGDGNAYLYTTTDFSAKVVAKLIKFYLVFFYVSYLLSRANAKAMVHLSPTWIFLRIACGCAHFA